MLVGGHQIIVHWIKGASAIEFFFLNKFCGFIDKVIQICFYYCRIFHVLVVFILWKVNMILAQSAKQLKQVFMFICIWEKALDIYFPLNKIWLCASTKTFDALFNSKQINLKKKTPDKSSFLKKTQNWNNNYIYCTSLFSSKTKLMYKCINAVMNKYWVTFEAYPKISFQNVKMNLKWKPQVIN